MRKEEKIRICDMCEKRVSEGEAMFGGSVFNGWFKVERTGGGTGLADLKAQNEWDICSKDCLKLLIETRLK